MVLAGVLRCGRSPSPSLDPKENLRYNQGDPNGCNPNALEDRRMPRTVLCLWDGCNASFRPRGNQRYCSKVCRREARRVQNRRAQRRRRLREHAGEVARVAATARQGRGDLSAVRTSRCSFRVPLRPVPWPGPPAGPPAGRLLLQTLSGGLSAGPAASPPEVPDASAAAPGAPRSSSEAGVSPWTAPSRPGSPT
jgi:hypothetical protein